MKVYEILERHPEFTEKDMKREFFFPLFASLGWNISDRNVVSVAECQSPGRNDYGLYLERRLSTI